MPGDGTPVTDVGLLMLHSARRRRARPQGRSQIPATPSRERDVIVTSVRGQVRVDRRRPRDPGLCVCVCVRADVNQTEPGDDVAGLKGSNVNHSLPNSEPGAGDAPPVSGVDHRVHEWTVRPTDRYIVRLINAYVADFLLLF